MPRTVGEQLYWPEEPEEDGFASRRRVPREQHAWRPAEPEGGISLAIGLDSTQNLFEELVERHQEDRVLSCVAAVAAKVSMWWETLFLPESDPVAILDQIQIWVMDRSAVLPHAEDRYALADALQTIKYDASDPSIELAVNSLRNWIATINTYVDQNREEFPLRGAMTIMWASKFAAAVFGQSEDEFYTNTWNSCN